MSCGIHSKKIRVGKLDISYLAGGQGEPLVVIHGGGEGAIGWLKNAKELARHYSIYIPDLPGFGESQPINDSFDVGNFVNFIDDFSSNLGLKRFHLMGHSMGAGIALRYALRSPGKISRLVLISSLCLGKDIALWVRFLASPTFCKSVGRIGIGVLKAVSWLAKFFFTPFISPLPKIKLDMGMSISTLHGQTTILISRLSELMMPTLVVWGGKDPIVPARHAYAAASVIPNCQVRIFEDCGHSVYRERLKEFCQLLTDFLKKR